MEAGNDFGLKPFGIRAMESLRVEKTYKLVGRDHKVIDADEYAKYCNKHCFTKSATFRAQLLSDAPYMRDLSYVRRVRTQLGWVWRCMTRNDAGGKPHAVPLGLSFSSRSLLVDKKEPTTGWPNAQHR